MVGDSPSSFYDRWKPKERQEQLAESEEIKPGKWVRKVRGWGYRESLFLRGQLPQTNRTVPVAGRD